VPAEVVYLLDEMSEGRRTTSEVAPHLHRVDGTTAQLPTDRRSRDSTAVPDGEATPPREVPDFLGTDGICLNRVSFRYEPQLEPVLHKITCHIPACPLTCLVGESGSGKSTALGLLTREIQEQQGPVLVDGRALCDFESTAICRQLAVVQQQVMIMDAAMVDNIQLGEADATDAEVRRAAQMECHQFVSWLQHPAEPGRHRGRGLPDAVEAGSCSANASRAR